jgi:TonB family protein
MRTLVAALTLFIHLSLLWCLIHWGTLTVRASPSVTPVQIITVASAPAPRISTNIAADQVKIDKFNDTLPMLTSLETPAESVAIERPNTGIIPPHPAAPIADASAFAPNSGVPTGVHVTVVLRVEVNGNGTLGRVQVEVSGGSALIDNAAIAYVRSLRWIGGRTGDRPASMWVRWGVPING